jgi:hypothetical protein
VWDSESFGDFLVRSLKIHAIEAEPMFVSLARANRFEYFGVWKKAGALPAPR